MARMLVLAALALLAPGLAASAEFSGRGVFAFRSGSGCPLANGGEDCNRLALDDEGTAGRNVCGALLPPVPLV